QDLESLVRLRRRTATALSTRVPDPRIPKIREHHAREQVDRIGDEIVARVSEDALGGGNKTLDDYRGEDSRADDGGKPSEKAGECLCRDESLDDPLDSFPGTVATPVVGARSAGQTSHKRQDEVDLRERPRFPRRIDAVHRVVVPVRIDVEP